MNILLTGGTGYIGSHTALVLAQAGHRITLFDNLCNSQISVASRLETLSAQKMDFVQGDVRDTPLLSSVLKERNIDAVIHFPGLKAVGDSVKNPVEYYANNVQGSISLLQAMQANHIKTLVFSSSATVYGVPHYLPYDETHPTKAINPYGSTKLQIEDMLRDVAASDPEWSIAVLRYFNPVGAHESGFIGEMPSGVPNNLMPYLVQVASGKREELRIFGNDYDTKDGTGERDYIHVMDLADGHLAALKYLLTNTGWHPINLGTGQSTSVLELVRTFESVTTKVIPCKIAERRDGDLPMYYAQSSKANQLLGWSAKRDLAEMCESAWRWEEIGSL
jgi:UDP-glucose 4-epimerase